jgi:hypothetical protein
MARRTFDLVDVTEILVHWQAGRGISEIAQSLGVDRKTIRKYVAPAIKAGMPAWLHDCLHQVGTTTAPPWRVSN